jgi:hypothetical protein
MNSEDFVPPLAANMSAAFKTGGGRAFNTTGGRTVGITGEPPSGYPSLSGIALSNRRHSSTPPPTKVWLHSRKRRFGLHAHTLLKLPSSHVRAGARRIAARRSRRCGGGPIEKSYHKWDGPMKTPRRRFLHLAAGAAILPATSRIASAQAYPSRPITLIVPSPPGGGTDVVARIMAERIGRPRITPSQL